MSVIRQIFSATDRYGVWGTLSRGKEYLFRLAGDRAKQHYVTARFQTIPDEERITWLDPNDLDAYLIEGAKFARPFRNIKPVGDRHELEKATYSSRAFPGVIIGGDWDLYQKPYEHDRVFQAINAWVNGGVRWEDTAYAEHLRLGDHINPNKPDNYSSEMKNRVHKLRNSLERDGYKDKNGIHDMVSVNIGRDGTLIFNNRGHHRLALSRALGLDEIKVSVQVVHPHAGTV